MFYKVNTELLDMIPAVKCELLVTKLWFTRIMTYQVGFLSFQGRM